MKNIYIVFLFFFLINSCKKDVGALVVFNGVLQDNITGKPIPGENITLIELDNHGPKSTNIASAVSNSSGNFQFQYHQGENCDYYCDVSENSKYFHNNVRISAQTALVLNMFPKAFLKVHVKNTTPVNSNDQIIFPNVIDNNNSLVQIKLLGVLVDTTFTWPQTIGRTSETK